MICSNCGTDNRAGRRFCAECGTSLSETCPNCGAANEAGEKFCGQCGSRLGNGGPTATQPQRPAAPAIAPPSGAASSVAQPQAERRLVSVLFADLVGFTSLSEARDPEEVRELLSGYFELARDSVDRYGGTIEKFIGDAVMAVWGTPVAHEDDAERAVRAGLALVEAVQRLGVSLNAPDLALRARVLTGEAAVTLGAQGQGMVAGDLVNTASRLQSVALPGTVLVGESTYQSAQEAIAFAPMGEHEVKGKALPVAAWQALRVVAKRGGIGRSEALEPPFVGRDEELRVIKDQLDATGREQRPRLLSVVGQAGIGKSRLAWEFLKYLDGVVEPIFWHQGRCPAYGEGVTFWALAEMVRQRAGIAETDEVATVRESLDATLAEHITDDEERRWIGPRLAVLLGLEASAPGERDELFAAWRTFFQRLAERNTTALLFEDLHWADSGLLDFIEHLLEWSRNSPLIVITLARPELLERRATWGAGQRSFINLRLEPLPEHAMRALLEGVVPGLPDEVRDRILARAEGIPLYAVETVRMLIARGLVQPHEGRYALTGEIGELDVPDSLHAVIAARLDALDPEDRRLLQDASVLGQTFTVASLASIREEDAGALEPRLRALVRRELLVLDADPRSPERGQYGFVQALVREVAYSTLGRRDRRARHLAAARYFETLGDETLTGALASHFLDAYRAAPEGPEGEAVGAQARRALRAAAERAAGLGSYDQAVAYLDQAIQTESDPDERATLNDRAGTLVSLGGHPEAGQRYLRAAFAHYQARDDSIGMARAGTGLADALMAGGQIELAIGLLLPLAERVAGHTEDEAVPRLHEKLARAYMRGEQSDAALEWAERALVAAERLGVVEVIAEAITTRAVAVGQLGRRQESTVVMRGALQFAEARGLTATELRLRINLALMLIDEDPAAAVDVCKVGLQLCERFGMRTYGSYLLGNASDAAWRTGDWEWAVERIEEWLGILGDPFDRLNLRQSVALINVCRGATTDAQLIELEEATREVSDPLTEVNNLRTRAWYDLTIGRPDDAYQIGLTAAALSPVIGPAAYGVAAHAAVMARDPVRLREAAAELRARAATARVTRADLATAEASIAALEGRVAEALEGYRSALAEWRELGLQFDIGLCGLAMLELIGPDNPEARAAGHEAREIFTRLGAAPFLARAESALRGMDAVTA